MRRNKVRGRDGAIRLVEDSYVLRDGETQVVELPFMDAKVHDGHGQPTGQRPGFLYSDGNEQAEQSRVDAYAEYDKTIRERWRGQPSKPKPAKPPQAFDSPDAAVAAAYVEYADAIQQRWRK